MSASARSSGNSEVYGRVKRAVREDADLVLGPRGKRPVGLCDSKPSMNYSHSLRPRTRLRVTVAACSTPRPASEQPHAW